MLHIFSLRLSLRENNLVNKEEDYHADAAVKDGGSYVVDKVRNELTCHGNPCAVDGVDNAGDNTECDEVPHCLVPNINSS